MNPILSDNRTRDPRSVHEQARRHNVELAYALGHGRHCSRSAYRARLEAMDLDELRQELAELDNETWRVQ